MTTLQPNELAMLLELSEALGSPLNLRASFGRALEILESDLRAGFGMIAFLDAATGELRVEAVSERHAAAAGKVRFRPGEGITGRVVRTGKPIAVPHSRDEPLFLVDLAFLQAGRGSKDDLSYLCVAIRGERRGREPWPSPSPTTRRATSPSSKPSRSAPRCWPRRSASTPASRTRGRGCRPRTGS